MKSSTKLQRTTTDKCLCVQMVLRDGIAVDRKKLAVCATLERDDTAMRGVKHGLDHGDSRHNDIP